MKNSKKFSLNLKDVAKASILTGITAGTSSIYTAASSGQIDFKTVATTSIIAAVSYFIKNFFTTEKTE